MYGPLHGAGRFRCPAASTMQPYGRWRPPSGEETFVTGPNGQDEFAAVCPYLGLADDADSHATYATEAHRCYRLTNPTRIASPHQETYCLGANHVSCPVYLGEGVPQTQRPATGAAAAGAATAAAGAAAVTEEAPVRGPRAGQRPRPATEPRPKRPAGGTLGPRPRSGGISMPVAT